MQIGTVYIDDVIWPVKIITKKGSLSLFNTLGEVKNYPAGYEEIFIEIQVKTFDHEKVSALKNFLSETAEYKNNSFRIIPEAGIDLSNGLGISILVRYWSDEFAYSYDKDGFYNSILLFRKEV
jgi:hypothetical protein